MTAGLCRDRKLPAAPRNPLGREKAAAAAARHSSKTSVLKVPQTSPPSLPLSFVPHSIANQAAPGFPHWTALPPPQSRGHPASPRPPPAPRPAGVWVPTRLAGVFVVEGLRLVLLPQVIGVVGQVERATRAREQQQPEQQRQRQAGHAGHAGGGRAAGRSDAGAALPLPSFLSPYPPPTRLGRPLPTPAAFCSPLSAFSLFPSRPPFLVPPVLGK